MRLLLITALTVAGCSAPSGSGQSNAGAPAAEGAVNASSANAQVAAAPEPVADNTTAPADTAADEAAVRDAITTYYASYNRQSGPDLKLSSAFDAAWKRAIGKDGAMEGDPFCQCQDYGNVSAKVRSVKIDGDHASAAVTFMNFGQASKIDLGLAREGGVWRMDDIFDEKGKGMKAEMLASKPGFWDIGAQ